MSKELEYIQRQINIVKQQIKGSKMKIIVTDAITKHQYDYYERELQTLESIEKSLNRLESIDNAEPSEALECLEEIKDIVVLFKTRNTIYMGGEKSETFNHKNTIGDEFKGAFDIIKQALLKAQEQNSTNIFKGSKKVKIEIPESSLMDYNPVKQYLKWEDLEFSFKDKCMKVKLNENIYTLRYTRNALMEFPVAYLEFDNTEITIIDCKKQFFNDLHLERVEE